MAIKGDTLKGRGESGPPHGHLIFCNPLREIWKRDKKNRTIGRLADLIEGLTGYGAEYVKQVLTNSDRNPTPKMIPAFSLLVLETDFCDQFLDLALRHRQEKFQSRRYADRFFRQLDAIYPQDEHFWRRWLLLYSLRYDSDADKPEKLEILETQINNLKNGPQLNPLAAKTLESLKILKGVPNRPGHLADALEIRLGWMNHCFALMTYLTATQWLRYRSDEVQKFGTEGKIAGMNSKQCFDKAGEALKGMQDACKDPDVQRSLGADTRMMELYLKGSELIGAHADSFRNLIPEERKRIIDCGDEILKGQNLEPCEGDSLHYRVWYAFYSYLQQQRVAHDSIGQGNFHEGIAHLTEALEILARIERNSGGNFAPLLLKVYQAQREGEFLRSSLKIILATRESNPTSITPRESGLTEWQIGRRKLHADTLVNWVDRLEKQPPEEFSVETEPVLS